MDASRRRRHHTHQSLSSFHTLSPGLQPHYRSLLSPGTSDRPLPPIPSAQPLPRPPIPEEDECPICHFELPSRTLPDFETARAAHISQCIADQIAAHNGHAPARPGAFTSNSQPPPTASYLTDAGSPYAPPSFSAAAHPPPTLPAEPVFPNTPEGRTAAREYRHAAVVLGATMSSSSGTPPSDGGAAARRSRMGMFPYTATEKDCIDDAECTICLEEFEVGVAMARLECLCRFHRKCIQDWFVGHPGRCPVHSWDGPG